MPIASGIVLSIDRKAWPQRPPASVPSLRNPITIGGAAAIAAAMPAPQRRCGCRCGDRTPDRRRASAAQLMPDRAYSTPPLGPPNLWRQGQQVDSEMSTVSSTDIRKPERIGVNGVRGFER